MAGRTVYGNTSSSNGWPMVDQEGCTWVDIPGTDPVVRIQIQNGQPLAILRAFVADINAYVEHVRDGDTACWTAGNSVSTSNHLSGTAVDVDWELHPFRIVDAGWNPDQIGTVREILDFYEGTVWWGNDWSDPKDAMHFQLGSQANGGDIDTYGNPHTADFIARKIRADGFSAFRREGQAPPPPPVVVAPPTGLSRAEGYAVRIINEGRRRGITPKGIQIALATGIVESNITVYANQKLPKSLALPHDAVGNDGYSVGIFQQQVRNTGNGWWWGDEITCMGVESSAGLFYDRLATLPYNGDSKSPGGFAQQIQGSAFPDRYDQHWGEAVALYNKLAGITAGPPPPPTQGEDELSAEAERKIDVIYQEVTKLFTSRSRLRHLGEGPKETLAGFVLNDDANDHISLVKLLAGYGHPETLALLQEIAGAKGDARYPDRQDDADLAQAILAEATSTAPVATFQQPSAPVQPQVVYLPAPVPESAPVVSYGSGETAPATTGQVIGRAYDALEELRLADALPIESRAPLAALIAVLQTKNGSELGSK